MAIVEFVAGLLKDNAMTLASIALVFYTAKLYSATKRYADVTEKMLEETGKQITAAEAMVEETRNQVRAMGELVNSINQMPSGIKKVIEPLTQNAYEEMADKRSEKRDEMQRKINRIPH